VEDEAGGDAGLVLRAGVQLGDKVIELDGAEPEMGNELDVNAGADDGGEGGSASGLNGEVAASGGELAGGDGLMRAAEEHMGERRDGRREMDFGAEEIGVLMNIAGAAGEGGAVVAAVVGGEAEEGKKTIGGGKFPAVQILVVRDGDGKNGLEGAGRQGADEGFGDGYRWAEIGVAAEDDEFVLSEKRRRYEGEKREEQEHPENSRHERSSKG